MSTAVQDARLLLEQFRNSGWRDMHVRTTHFALFIAKPGGGPNPLRSTPASAAIPSESKSIVAPHIGTVAWVEAVGAEVAPGATVARVEVLGTLIDIASEVSGRVHRVAAPIGTLVEFGATIATLVATHA
jgi:acetyl-CoA carboxylase biotin carboxyl carrier protein